MWPWGHAAVGYLVYSSYTRFRYDQSPNGVPVLVLLFGTQFPDLIDKPLAWTLGILPSGRSFAHSLLVLIPLSILVYALAARYRDAEWGWAFAIGALSHAIVDVVPATVRGEFVYTTSLLWPLSPVPPYDEQGNTIANQFLALEPTPSMMAGIALTIMAFIVWWRDGQPGVETVRTILTLSWRYLTTE